MRYIDYKLIYLYHFNCRIENIDIKFLLPDVSACFFVFNMGIIIRFIELCFNLDFFGVRELGIFVRFCFLDGFDGIFIGFLNAFLEGNKDSVYLMKYKNGLWNSNIINGRMEFEKITREGFIVRFGKGLYVFRF